jgi:hypothetical protein
MYHPLVRRSSGFDQISESVSPSLRSVLFTTICIAPQQESHIVGWITMLYALLPLLLTMFSDADGYAWMEKLTHGEPATTLHKRAATCPVHLTPQGAAPYSEYYPSRYTGARDGLPGTGKGGVLVPAANDTAHAYSPPSSSDIRGPCPGLNMAASMFVFDDSRPVANTSHRSQLRTLYCCRTSLHTTD